MEGENQESENEHKEKSIEEENIITKDKVEEKAIENHLEVEIDKEKESIGVSESVKNSEQMITEEVKNVSSEVELPKNESLSVISTYSGDEDTESDDNRTETVMTKPIGDISDPVVSDKVPIVKSQKSGFSKPQSSSSSSSETSEDSSSSDDENTSCDFSDSEVITQNRLGPNKKPPMKKDPLELDNLPPIENLQISVKEEECMPIGKVFSIVDRLLVIESFADTPALMLDTILFNRDGQPLGQIYDVFGHIKKPFYSVRFNKNEDIVNAGLEVEKVIYCAPKTEHTKYIFTSQLLKEKGSDASWINNEEPPPQCLDYSDDEQERKAKQKFNNKKKNDDDDDEVILVKVEQGDSPARKRYLSFEEQMNRNNTLRTKAYKRAASSNEKTWDGGWHNYKRNFGSGTAPLPDRNREYSFVRGATYRASPPGNHQWLNQQFSQQPNQPRMRSQPLFQFGGNPSFTQPPMGQNFPRVGYRSQGLQGTCSLGPPPQGFQSRQSPPQMFPQALASQSYGPVNTYPLNPGSQTHQQNFQASHSSQGFSPMSQVLPSQPVFRGGGPTSSIRPQQFPPFPQQNYQPPQFQNTSVQSFQSTNQSPKVPSFQNMGPNGHPTQAYQSSLLQSTDNQGQASFQPPSHPNNNASNFTQNQSQQVPPHCKCFQSNHRPPPIQNQGSSVQHYQPRIPFIPGFVSSPPPPPLQFRPNSGSFNVTSPPPPPFSSFPPRQQFPVQFQFMGNGSPPFRNSSPNFRNAPLPPPP
ncbi:H/ACA ribonucleoprotein complex non-core subunit NAF1 [Cimex lectularius]|uniref:H/ACA ribonucleoprotein complex non-core subunit NAF1 n=1 Tax=Cimex lectularius TaxID=79782 RepID=A0A8I6RUG5_CIMLE|nr:H/ACA ribonucleoprotein complex non-core subunit NAF1 [Cimex lectularius]XP_014252664.1 H/ACA ribonucleoprotein complex non-core subunit NAF1 [Cimex lectularius]XP_014252665.1 H/ACA ribonucleoprotein complex non-core subunit NAF1 [Cimex lectularius]XP_014252666.1 H/ACA ribonucleoprotein complex non-core subunit NAF1 [Cimex lectularius]XP_024086268.1 H/ACA ribonucleoprotein complex non-core subunit NAF1 [Cimex lectularius]